MGDPESDRRRRRESLRKGKQKRVRINVFDGEESDEWVETEEEWVRIHGRPRRDLFSPHDSDGVPKLSDISKRSESIVCGSLTNGETKGARVKSIGRPVAGETRRCLKICLGKGQEAQDPESLGRC